MFERFLSIILDVYFS